MTNLTGHSLGRYHLLEKLGEGGMAIVYKAYDTRLETDVAVKVIRTENLTLGTMERALKRFEREAKALARLTHPNIVKVTDYGEYDGKPYLVMPYLPGGTLKQKLGKPIPWQEAVRLLLPVAEALEYAHSQNMIHRDVKPANILLTHSGRPMLSDFGIAKLLDLEETMELTGTSAAIGTPEYMAPEQASAKTVDHRADIYALGIVLYEMVTGRKPFVADTPMAVLIKQATEPLPRPKQFVPNLPDRDEKILLKALAKRPEDRYQSMAEFSAALEGKSSRAAPEGTRTRSDFTPTIPDLPTRNEGSSTRSAPKLLWIGLGILGIALCAGLLGWALGGGGSAELFPTRIPAATYTPVLTSTPTVTHTPIATEPPASLGVGSTWTSPKDGMIMLYVPAGEFSMGSESGGDDEKPIHTVYLDSFWIDQTEVTNEIFAKFIDDSGYVTDAEKAGSSYVYQGGSWELVEGADWDHPSGPSSSNSGKTNFPVIHVSWNDAKSYCEWVDRRLPTEAEWEKAARGTDARTYPWGNDSPNSDLLNYDQNIGDTTEVGKYPNGASFYGALDMAGNVWEWVADWYSETFYASSPASNPLGPASGQYRVLRGGSWSYYEYSVRSALRDRLDPADSDSYGGFRCSRSP